MFASPARSSNKQTPTDHTDDWKELLDFREKIQNALEADEITEEEYDQFQEMADQMEEELQGLSGAEFAHSYADDDTLDSSNISNENSKTRNSTRGENNDNRRI